MPANPLEWRHEHTGRCDRFAELDAILSRGKGRWANSRAAYRTRRRAYLEGKRDHHTKGDAEPWRIRRSMLRKRDTQTALQSGRNDKAATHQAASAA